MNWRRMVWALAFAAVMAASANPGANAAPDERAVTVHDGAADPAVSPDGKSIAASILGKIWIVPMAGGAGRQVSQGIGWDTHPAWSPNGEFLVYSHQLPSECDLVSVDLATGTQSVVFDSKDSIGHVEFARIGEEIYLVSQASQLDAHVVKIPTAGGAAKPITETANWHEWDFTLSPNAQQAFLASGRYGGANLFLMNMGDRAAKRLSTTQWNQFAPQWSADGSTLYYIESANGVDSVMAMPAAGGAARAIFSSPYDDKELSLSPDGKTAVLCAGRKLFRLNLESGKAESIPFEARFVLPAQSAGDMVVTHARLWDGSGAAPVADATIEIRGGKIASIGHGETATQAAGVPVIDAAGKTVMPALMDNHYHFWYASQGPPLLSQGITTIRDPGAPLALSLNFKEAIAMGLFAGPDIYTAGPLIDGPGAYHPMVAVMLDKPEAAAGLVRAFKAQGVDTLKVYFMLKPDVLCAVIREAHNEGLRVTGHIGVKTSWDQAMACGIDGVNHIRVWADFLPASEQPQGEEESLDSEKNLVPRMQADWHEIDPESARVTALIQEMAKDSVGFDPTLSIQAIADPMRKVLGLDQFTAAQESYKRMGRFVQRSQEMGVQLLAGTDDGSLFDEMEAYAKAGVPNEVILKAATVNGAKWLRLDSEFGTIASGKRADLIFVDGDPLKDVHDMRKITLVVKDGRVVFRK